MTPCPATRPHGRGAAATLWSQAGWVMPAMGTVSVFSVLVSLSLVFATVQPALARFLRNGAGFLRSGADGDLPSRPELFELRSPERAVAEVARGMLRV